MVKNNFFSEKILPEKQDRFNTRVPESFCIRHTGSRVCIVGKPGSGKSCKFSQQICMPGGAFYRAFHRCYFIAPESTLQSVENHPFIDHPRTMHELSSENLEYIMNECKQNKQAFIDRKEWEAREKIRREKKVVSKKKINFTEFDDNEEENYEKEEEDPEPPKVSLHQSLLILDDVGVQLKDKNVQKALLKMFSTSRHLSLTVLVIVQSYLMLPLSIRKLLSHAVLYKNLSLREKQTINNEFLGLSKLEAKKFFDYMLDKNDIDYCTCVLNREDGRIYRDFQEVPVETLNSL